MLAWAPTGTDWTFSVDWLSERRLGHGSLSYNRVDEVFDIGGAYAGVLDMKLTTVAGQPGGGSNLLPGRLPISFSVAIAGNCRRCS